MCCVDREYTSNKESLDQVPLRQFAWVLQGPETSFDGQEGSTSGSNGQEGSTSGSNGQQAPVNGSMNGLHQSSNGTSANGQKAPMNGSAVSGHRMSSTGASSNGASANGQQIPVDVPVIPATPPNGQQASSNGTILPPAKQQEPVFGPQPPPDSPPPPKQWQLQDLNDLRDCLNNSLPRPLAERLWKTATLCCAPHAKMSLDAAQDMIIKVLDQAEELQAQIITDAWYVHPVPGG